MTKALEKTTAPLAAVPAYTREQVELIRRTIAKGATDDELQLFMSLCRRTQLDPFSRQIYAIKRWDGREKREVMQAQASIDGLRLIADRTGKYEGQEGPFWCGLDGNWRDVWVSDEPPIAAKVGAFKTGCRTPFWGVARHSEYVQTDRSGSPNTMWSKMAANQLAKCAESLALRKAFPQELSGVYSADELDHTDNGAEPVLAPTPGKPWTSFRGMIDEFAKLHARLGQENDHIYRETLRKHGAEHSNQFKDPAKAVAAYAELLATVQTLEAQTDADDPPEARMTSLQPLWAIEDELAALLDSVDTCPPELQPELEERIAEYIGHEIEKVDRVNGVLTMLDQIAANAKDEIDRLYLRKQAAQRAAERLSEYILHLLRKRDGKPLKGRNVTFSIRRSEAVIITDPNIVPDEWKRTTVTTDILKTPIKAALKNGAEIPGVVIEERENLVRK